MKRLIALCLVVVCLLSLVACSTNDTDNTKPQAGLNNTTTNPNDNTTANPNDNTTANPNDNTTANPNDNTTEPPVDNDATIKAELIAKVGMPFRLWRTEGMSLWCFTISENSAERNYSNSMEGQFIAKSLSWNIENGELVITGDWNETFTLDLNTMEATSKTDGAVYSIIDKG